MSIIDTLITDRTQADVTKLKSLLSKPKAMWTNEEWSEFLLAKDKGAYNATDLNRVQEAMEYLAERFRGYGYNVPEIKRPSITEVIPGTSKLPEGYTELEYIQGTGKQYVNTEFVPNQDTRVVCDCEYAATFSASWLFGARVSVGKSAFAFLAYENKFRTDYNNSYSLYFGAGTTKATHVDKAKNVTVVNGSETIDDTYAAFNSQYSLFLLAVNTGGTASGYATAKIKSCKIYDNGTLVRDFIPAMNSSGVVGLYDLVSKAFFGNAGTGYFLPGPAVSLPEGYARLKYIRSTGTQYIDTDFIPNQDTRVMMDIEISSIAKYGSYLFGIRKKMNSLGFSSVLLANQFWTEYKNEMNGSSVTIPVSRYTVDANKNVFTLSANGEAIKTVTRTYSAFTCEHSLMLLALISTDTTDDYTIYDGTQTSGKLYSCQIYDNGTLARLYTPALNASGEVGLYDSIGGRFYANAGTGAFVAGDGLESSGNIPSQTIIRDYWEIGDISRQEQMDQYLTNLGYVKNVLGLLKSTPESPATMNYLTYTEANAIEQILVDIEFVITHTVQSMSRLNAFMLVSGYRPFPSSISDYGRTWDDIDALELNWDDLADGEAWYTMQYGVIK